MPHPQNRTVTKHRTRTRRLTACHRHPSEPVTGFCALCLRDRLAGLDPSSGQVELEKVVAPNRRTRDHGVAPAPVPELRRSKSVAADKCEGLNSDNRRKSCDVRGRSSLSDLFVVESMNLNFEAKEDDIDDIDVISDEIRVSDDVFVRNEIDDLEEVGDLKTMKEYIEIELQNKRKNFWETASVFSRKLRKWRLKQKEKKQSRCFNNINRSKLGQSEVADYGFGRRSCDTEPQFSIDAHRLSVEDPRFSFDEHRASWDGYMIARTIPRLTPMLPVVDNMMGNTTIENLQMHSISEDGASSGGSGQSNSDTSTSNRGSSSCSTLSSSTKTVNLGGDDVKSALNACVSPTNDVIYQGTKLVITEKELKDLHLNSVKNNNIEPVSNAPISTTMMNASNANKKVVSSRWRKVCNLWGHKKIVEDIPENRIEKGNSGARLVRNPSCVKSRIRRDEFALDRNRSTRYSTSDVDSGLLRLYLTPFRNTRRGKSGKSRAPSMATNGLQ